MPKEKQQAIVLCKYHKWNSSNFLDGSYKRKKNTCVLKNFTLHESNQQPNKAASIIQKFELVRYVVWLPTSLII